MPIYEYQCDKCGRGFEYFQAMSEPSKSKCEKCGGKLSKLLSAAGFVLKGGGWYKDLYGSAKPDAGGGGEDGASTTAKADGDKDKGASSSEGESSLGRKAAPASGSGKAAATGKKPAAASKTKSKASGKPSGKRA